MWCTVQVYSLFTVLHILINNTDDAFFSSHHLKVDIFNHAADFAYCIVFVKCHSGNRTCEKHSVAQGETEWRKYIIHSLSQKLWMFLFYHFTDIKWMKRDDDLNKPVYWMTFNKIEQSQHVIHIQLSLYTKWQEWQINIYVRTALLYT